MSRSQNIVVGASDKATSGSPSADGEVPSCLREDLGKGLCETINVNVNISANDVKKREKMGGTQEPKSRELRTAASPQKKGEGTQEPKSREFRTAASPEDCKESNTKDSIRSHHIYSSLSTSTSPTVGLNPGETASQAILASQGCIPRSALELRFLAKNVQSIMTEAREIELLETIDDSAWDILFLSETWRTEKEEIWFTEKGHLFLGSGWKQGHRGVAIMIHCRHTKGFKQFQAVSERLCAAAVTIFGYRLRLISPYMPDSTYDDADVEAMYMQMTRLCDNAKHGRMHVIIGGDMNAVVGERRAGEGNAVGPHATRLSNDRGEWLKNWANLNEMAITNTFFNQDLDDQWSYQSGGVRRLLDYIITDSSFLNKFMTSEIRDEIGVGYDHRTVAATAILADRSRRRRDKSSPSKVRKGWKPTNDADYKLIVEKRVNEAKESETDSWTRKCAEEKCRAIETILKESANVQAQIEASAPIADCRLALRRMINDRKSARRAGDKAAEKSCSKMIQRELKALQKARCSAKVENILRDFRDLKRLEKTRTRKVKEMIGSMLSTDGAVKHDRGETAEVFSDFYRSLYADASRVMPNGDGAIQHGAGVGTVEDITPDEVEAQMKRMSNGKGADASGMIAEIIKFGGPDIAAELAGIYNEVLHGSEEVPAYWKNSKISVLFKKGDRQQPGNYRPICITPILYRLFSKVILKRIHARLESAQSNDQAGFRKSFGCMDHIFALTQIAEKANEYGLPLWIAAIDFQKAFDSVSHAAIWDALAEQGVEETYIDMLRRLYDGQVAEVQTDVTSSTFPIEKGTKQGDPISSIIFNAVVEMFMTKVKKNWKLKKYGLKIDHFTDEEYLTNLRYADDILLVARSLPQIKKMLADVGNEASKVGLKLHPDKTKIMHNGIGYGSNVRKAVCGSMSIEVLDRDSHTAYLGRVVRLTDMNGEEIRSRIAKAWSKYGVFRNELNDRNVPLALRLKLFDAVVTPTILYGSETWTMTKQLQKKLRATQRKMMRLLIHAHRSYNNFEDHVEWIKDATRRAELAMATHNIKCWSESQNTRMWDWACKVAQKHDGRWTYTAAKWQPVAVRVRGRPKTRWHDTINAYLTQATGNNHTQDDWIVTLAKTSSGTERRAGFLAHARLTGSIIDEET